MSSLRSIRSYAALGRAIPSYVRKGTDLTLESALAHAKARLEDRETRFLSTVDLCIFGNPASPYLPLLKAAGWEFGDIEELVHGDGLESALGRLRREGVFITFEEFKGREPVERGSLSFEVSSDDFANPRANRHVSVRTSGSTGRPTTTWTSLEYRETWLPNLMITYAAHDVLGVPTAWFWGADPSQIVNGLTYSKLGRLEAWFATRRPRREVERFHGLARRLIAGAARLGGMKLPKVQWVDHDDALPVVRWMQSALRSRGQCFVEAGVSGALRIAIAALENGIDLTGATLAGTGEPPTPAKVSTITKAGAKWIPWFGFSEGGHSAWGCADPVDETDMHLWADRHALIQHPRRVPGSDLMVDAFNFTSLSPIAPRVLLNVELDDFGILETRDCGCPFGELGYRQHLRQVFSFRKLTGGGITLVGSDMLRIIDDVLPARFGGSSLDYQLLEEEDENGFTRFSMVIHPRVTIGDEDQVVRMILEELSSTDRATSRVGASLAQRGTFRIKRMEPIASGPRGKILPLHFSRRSPAQP